MVRTTSTEDEEDDGFGVPVLPPGTVPQLYDLDTVTPMQEFKVFDKQNDDTDVVQAFPMGNKRHKTWLISAIKRSGKSTLILNAIEIYGKEFTDIYFLSPTAEDDPKFEKLVEKCRAHATFYRECSNRTILHVIADMRSNIKAWKREKLLWEAEKKDPFRDRGQSLRPPPIEPRHLFLMDDGADKFGSPHIKDTPLVMLNNNAHHLKTSIWLASQRFGFFIPAMRTNADMLTFFRIPNLKEEKNVLGEISCPRMTFLKCLALATKDDYSFLHIHFFDRGRPTFFKKTQRIIVPDSERYGSETLIREGIVDSSYWDDVPSKPVTDPPTKPTDPKLDDDDLTDYDLDEDGRPETHVDPLRLANVVAAGNNAGIKHVFPAMYQRATRWADVREKEKLRKLQYKFR